MIAVKLFLGIAVGALIFAFLLSNLSDAAMFGAFWLGVAIHPFIKWAEQ